MVGSWLRHPDRRLGLAPLLNALRRERSTNYASLLVAPPISAARIAAMLLARLVTSGLVLTVYYSPTAERAASSPA